MKTPIPGTEWIRVKTTEGNIFFSHKAKKTSIWTVPDEIKDALEALEKEEEEQRQRAVHEELESVQGGIKRVDEERLQELERVKAELKGDVGKRKAEEPVAVDEVVISKKPRMDEEEEDEEEEESEEEDWQREAAVQLAAEAEEEKRKQEEREKLLEEEKARESAEMEAQKNRPLNMPDRVDLSIDEAKALFKVSLSTIK